MLNYIVRAKALIFSDTCISDSCTTGWAQTTQASDADGIAASDLGLAVDNRTACASSCDNIAACTGYDYDLAGFTGFQCRLSLAPTQLEYAATSIHFDKIASGCGSKSSALQVSIRWRSEHNKYYYGYLLCWHKIRLVLLACPLRKLSYCWYTGSCSTVWSVKLGTTNLTSAPSGVGDYRTCRLDCLASPSCTGVEWTSGSCAYTTAAYPVLQSSSNGTFIRVQRQTVCT